MTTAKLSDSRFKIEDLILRLGENKINARAIADSTESDFSQTQVVFYDNREPKLEVKEPSEGQNFYSYNRVKVVGSTEKDAQVFVNGFLASIDFEGNFEVFVPVSEGETSLEIKAIDPAGNTKTETRKVNFRK